MTNWPQNEPVENSVASSRATFLESTFGIHKNDGGKTSGLVDMARAHFDYDPNTGELTHKDPGVEAYSSRKGWLIASRFFGKKAGSVNSSGYVRVQVRNKSFQASRLIWAIVYGYDPEHDIDHIDLDRTNNRLENLREATRSQNCMNKRRRSDNRSGFKGVHWHRASNSWVAAICCEGKTKHLGCFKTAKDASDAYEKAALLMHGDFSNINEG